MLDENIDVDILKIAHHGSKYSYSKSFFKKTNPKTALISVGEYNSCNHPDVELMKYLNEHKIKTFRTDFSGNCYMEIYDDFIKSYDSREYVREMILAEDKKLIFVFYMIMFCFCRRIFVNEERCLKLKI